MIGHLWARHFRPGPSRFSSRTSRDPPSSSTSSAKTRTPMRSRLTGGPCVVRCAGHAGIEVDTQDDALFFAFETAPAAPCRSRRGADRGAFVEACLESAQARTRERSPVERPLCRRRRPSRRPHRGRRSREAARRRSTARRGRGAPSHRRPRSAATPDRVRATIRADVDRRARPGSLDAGTDRRRCNHPRQGGGTGARTLRCVGGASVPR